MRYVVAFLVAALLEPSSLLMVGGEEPVSSSQVSQHSRYHRQVEFISNYLLHASVANITDTSFRAANNTYTTSPANTTSSDVVHITNNETSVRQSSFSDKAGTRDNNTHPNDIQVIPVPAAVSSAIDTLPVHPRIPRRSSTRRRSRNEHRHSTRVFQGQPVRFLLPPLQNELFEPQSFTTSTPASTNAVPDSTDEAETQSITTEAADHNHELLDNKLDQRDSKRVTSVPQHRRVFIPPPLRYLLPPFFYENYINAQSTTSSTVSQSRSTEPFTLLTENYYTVNLSEPSNKSVESSSLAPIIVVETVSQPEDEQDWNYPEERREYNTSASSGPAYKQYEKEIEERKSSTAPYQSAKVTSTSIPPQYSKIIFENPLLNDYDEENIERYQSSLTSSSSTTTPFPQTSESFSYAYGRYKTTGNYPSSSTTSSPSTSTTSFPFLRGPNIEQALFETGEFQPFNTSNNDSGDPTLSMMNRPLLAQEVARAGMKITAHIKKEQLNRGKSKFRHLNQFNFESERHSRGSKSSQLDVAESSYYNGRRASKQVFQEADIRSIPGRAGKDYPTFTKPPKSDFSCRSVSYHRGYVADPSTGCQVFYICVGDGPGEPMLCPNGTIFSQDFLVCDWWYNVDCHRQS